jgi:PAS domain S-box-containing protein
MKRLLVVDDDEENLYLLRMLLEGQGFAVDLANNGAEALEKARQDPPDLIVSDILMPVMDGFALCRQWKADDCLSRVPFVFYTATYTDRRDEQLALDLGADAFIIKPAEPENFMAEILAVLARAEAGHPVSPHEIEGEGKVTLQQYNEALVRKLECKMLQLENANQTLEQEILERKRAEESLRLTQFSVDHAADSVFWTDSAGRLLHVSDSTCRNLGYQRDELLAMTLFDLVPSLSLEQWSRNWDRIKETGTFAFETVHRAKDGKSGGEGRTRSADRWPLMSLSKGCCLILPAPPRRRLMATSRPLCSRLPASWVRTPPLFSSPRMIK